IRASRPRACSSDSSTRTPPPSPHTKPSRPASNGRDAFCGSSLRVDIAFIEQKPAMVSGTTMASAPPAIITSASPRGIGRRASPSAWLPVARAGTTAEVGPLAPKRIETSPDAMLTMSIGMKNGETRSGPFSMSILCASRSEEMPPMPEPMSTPKRVPSSLAGSRPESSTAMTEHAIAYLRYGSSRRASFLSTYFSSSKLRTSPAMRVTNWNSPLAVLVCASNFVIGPMPDLPCVSADQNSSTVLPTGVSAPMPVTTTRRGSTALRVVLDVLDGVADGHDLLGVLVRDLDVEVLLQGHDELDGIEGVGAQVFDELRGRSDVVLLRSEEHTSELQSPCNLVCRLLLEKK